MCNQRTGNNIGAKCINNKTWILERKKKKHIECVIITFKTKKNLLKQET